jgi:hypothetical protein
MKITELLNEAAKKQSAKSDLPEPTELEQDDELEDEDEDLEDDELEDEDDEDTVDIEDFKGVAGSLGSDLYSLTAYDYSNEFSSVGPNDQIMNILEPLSKRSKPVADYLSVELDTITDDKVVSAVILNERNGEMFGFYAGTGGALFSPPLSTLTSKRIVDPDQVTVLKRIESAGKDYAKIVKRVDWDAGEEASDSIVYDSLDGLTYALRLPDLPEPVRAVPDSELSPEELERNKEMNDRVDARVQAAIAKYLADKQAMIKKTGGAGRKKR